MRQVMTVSGEIAAIDRQLLAWHAHSEASRRLSAIPGLGILTATALAATVTDPNQFHWGRQFAAWLGLTPQQHSTGGRVHLGGISKQGDHICAGCSLSAQRPLSVISRTIQRPLAKWVRKLMEKKPFRLVSVALANKLARIAWVVLTRKETYQPYKPLA